MKNKEIYNFAPGEGNKPLSVFRDQFSEENKELKKRTQVRIIRSVWFNKEAQPEKHYLELLMLFTYWQNEEADLLKNYSTFEEHYLARRDEIGEQMQQYAIC